jgi:ABC-type lipoprotein release transport system permease subunit
MSPIGPKPFSASLPARKAARLNLIEALRCE